MNRMSFISLLHSPQADSHKGANEIGHSVGLNG
jgi:hypothetical protein